MPPAFSQSAALVAFVTSPAKAAGEMRDFAGSG
jgi:hypothetical protein